MTTYQQLHGVDFKHLQAQPSIHALTDNEDYQVIIASLYSTVDTFMQNYLSITQNMHIIVIQQTTV